MLRPEEVNDFQRARIVSAMVDVVAEVGYVNAAVAPVVARAGVSRRTFYELFNGREDCFLAAFEWGVEQVRTLVVDVYSSQRLWRDKMRHALAALLLLFDAQPQLARMCIVEAMGAGQVVLGRRNEVMAELIAVLEAQAPKPRSVPGGPLLAAEAIVGGAFSVIHARLIDRASAPLIGLHGQLMGLIALPYLGPRAAGEETGRPVPDLPKQALVRVRGEDGRLLGRLDMRLTYRTVRCLLFIGEYPGVSNREVAEGAEISDEGQASKLLGRLAKLDLVANSRPPGPGLPNRWTLTPRGEQLLSSVHSR
jgi:AcrR family transcriptional regulator/DNA-binding MarR family transcriptional regulator